MYRSINSWESKNTSFMLVISCPHCGSKGTFDTALTNDLWVAREEAIGLRKLTGI